MKGKGYIAIILLLLLCDIQTSFAQKRNNLIIATDHLILQLDLQSPEKILDSILKIAGVGASGGKILKGDFTVLITDGWNEVKRGNNIIEFNRSLADLNNNPQSKPYQVTTQISTFDIKPGYPEEVKFGVNKQGKVTVYELSSGLTRFILPGYLQAKRVFLSGSFNSWSTLKGLMKKTDGGWLIDIRLGPGVYEYKYIADGRWITDPNNLLVADDGADNVNSVYFRYNATFKLAGYPLAHRITLTGDFNNWDGNQLIMEKKGNIWQRQLFLEDGEHTYNYIIDGQRITDPANPVVVKDKDGNPSSVLNSGETVRFKLAGYSKAKKVFVAGNFNHWDPNKLSLKREGNEWVFPITLAAGNYNYKFIVDGEWITDPLNPYYAVEDGETNSFVAVNPNHVFKLKGYNSAKKVKLAGNFTKWDDGEYTLAHKGNEWILSLYLKPGKYIYRFNVDGRQITDPGNKFWEPGEDDTTNSVLWME